MTNRQLRKKIREAFSHGTPDISQKIVIDTLFCEQQEQNGAELSVVTKRKPVRFRVFGITAAACAAIAGLAISINLIISRPQSGSVDYISIDKALEAVFTSPSPFPIAGVTPTVEWELDAESATPHYDITLKYGGSVDYQYVVDALSGEILSMEQVLQKTDPKEPITLEEAKRIVLEAAQLEENKITDCVVEMYLVTDEPHYDISFRKGNGFHRYKLDPFTGEILDKYILHAMDNISEDAARDIALKKAQVSADQISNYCIEWEGDEWPIHYDISFSAQGVIYKFEIHAVSGEILEMETEPTAEAFISENDAKAIALVSVQLTESQITAYSSNFKYDSRNPRYEVIFVANNVKYNFEIHAITGNILNSAMESVLISDPSPVIVVVPPVSVALKHAGLTQEEVTNLESHGDLEDGILHIDVSFIARGLKYEYEVKANGTIMNFETEPMEDDFISPSEATEKFYEYLNITPQPLAINLNWTLVNYQNRMCYDIVHTNSDGSAIQMKIDATTGALLFKEIPDGFQPVPTPPDGKLSAHQATYIALTHINLSSTDQVDNFQLREDPDGDIPHYDVSFRYQCYQYTLEISMYDGGQILSAEKEAIYGND